jgi:hypothetical protein
VIYDSPSDLLALHAVRILGFADTVAVADRFDLDASETEDLLRDAEAHGWTTYTAFGDTAGWSLTDRGRAENERRLASELTDARGEEAVRGVYHEFPAAERAAAPRLHRLAAQTRSRRPTRAQRPQRSPGGMPASCGNSRLPTVSCPRSSTD